MTASRQRWAHCALGGRPGPFTFPRSSNTFPDATRPPSQHMQHIQRYTTPATATSFVGPISMKACVHAAPMQARQLSVPAPQRDVVVLAQVLQAPGVQRMGRRAACMGSSSMHRGAASKAMQDGARSASMGAARSSLQKTIKPHAGVPPCVSPPHISVPPSSLLLFMTVTCGAIQPLLPYGGITHPMRSSP